MSRSRTSEGSRPGPSALFTLIRIIRAYSVPLLLGVIAAVIWANVDHASYHAFVRTPLRGHWTLTALVNEIFMALFFGIAAVEITDSLVPGGSLNPPSRAIPALMATAGGVVGPVGLYFLLNAFIGGPELTRGWGIPTATDIALAWLVARLVFGDGHPAVTLLLLLAIADDAVGLFIIAAFYPDPAHAVSLMPLLLVGLGMLLAYILRRMGILNYWPYLILGGVTCWTGLYVAHLHPALALVAIVPFLPHRRVIVPETTGETSPKPSTLMHFEHQWKAVVDFGLLFFGLANAGVEFSSIGPVTWIVFLSLFLGKTAGIFGGGLLARLLGAPLPAGMTMRDLLLVSMIGGIGLTVALFVSGAAFTDPAVEGAAKMGALGSGLIGPLVLLLAALWKPHPSPTMAQQ